MFAMARVEGVLPEPGGDGIRRGSGDVDLLGHDHARDPRGLLLQLRLADARVLEMLFVFWDSGTSAGQVSQFLMPGATSLLDAAGSQQLPQARGH